MNFDLTIRSKAKFDLEDIELHYDGILNKLTESFFHEFYEALDRIKKQPHLYPIKYTDLNYNEVHVALMRRFPYGIHFIIKAGSVIVRRVLHTSRYVQ